MKHNETTAVLVKVRQPANTKPKVTWTEQPLMPSSRMTVSVKWQRARGGKYNPVQVEVWFWSRNVKHAVAIPIRNVVVED